MNGITLNINSISRTSGTPAQFSITIPWILAYNTNYIKVLQVIIPNNFTVVPDVIYVASDMVGGIDNGYSSLIQPILGNVNLSIIAVVPYDSSRTNTIYDGILEHPYYRCEGTFFAGNNSNSLPQPPRVINFALVDKTGALITLNSDWNITIRCSTEIPHLHVF
jgi:hypothetical protein